MFIRTLLLICFMLWAIQLSAQKITYLDKDGNETIKNRALYVETVLPKTSELYCIVKQNMRGDTLSTIYCSSVNPLVREGATKLFSENGNLNYLKLYSNNKLNGTLKRFYDNGKTMSIVEFNQDSIVYKRSYDKNELEIEYINDYILPKFKNKSIDLFRKYLVENMNYPQSAIKKKKTGKFKVEFSITVSGKIDNIIIIGDKVPEIENEIIRVLKNTDNEWTPAFIYGEPTAHKYSMTLNFSF
jgi:hypothetical protein